MHILLVLFQSATFAVQVESAEQCAALWQVNRAYWRATGQAARAVCMPSLTT